METTAAPAPTDSEAVAIEHAEEAGLSYTSDQQAGYRRKRQGRGFTYLTPSGTVLTDQRVKAWIKSLAIPPAWDDVWICAERRGHLLVTGHDQRGRKQYRYHPEWRRVRDEDKFAQLAAFGEGLPALRDQVDHDLRGRTLSRDRVVALVVKLLDLTLVRVGNAEYAEDNESFGLTTLRSDHVDLAERRMLFRFDGKGGKEYEVEVQDRALTRAVRRCHQLGGQELFAYEGSDGAPVDITSSHVNDYLRDRTGLDISAKVFRTWGGTVTTAEQLALTGGPADSETGVDTQVLEAIDVAAAALGNTRTVCRNSYVHPEVEASFRSGRLREVWPRVRQGRRLSRAERLVLRLISD